MSAPPLPAMPDIAPSLGSSRSVRLRATRAEFGDGYSQRAGAGLNPARQEWALRWELLTSAEAGRLAGFLSRRGGHEAFSWVAPGEAQARRWTCAGLEGPTPSGGSRWSLSATFTEEFGP